MASATICFLSFRPVGLCVPVAARVKRFSGTRWIIQWSQID
ncbi:MAG: hypothetical protein AAF215_10280 [Cyanobacteria bacterium P01_A01_bin.123]